jgi:predicted transcriptional regulator
MSERAFKLEWLMTAALFEEISERGRFVSGGLEGLADDEAGRTLTTAEVRATLEKKLGPIPWR